MVPGDIQLKLTVLKSSLEKKYPLKTMAIFGSYSRNDFTEDSDLDILVEFNGKIGARFINLAEELEEGLGLKVDLVSRNGIKPKYYEAIKNDLIYV
ncbi:nucleotidyltransferase family protein [Cryomorphaceae bacterium 1068]|nr:nucleotidyltransferase family protein [Cryomorphaceae bacterium 1068]